MNTTLERFKVIGISVKTSNKDGQAGKDIPKLWGKFMGENLPESIPNKISEEIFSIYTDYEGDFMAPYTVILGCKVSSLENIPKGMRGITLEKSQYEKFTAKGDLAKGVVYQEWEKIWKTDLERTYTADFEVYGEKSQNQANAEVDIFIATK